MVASKTAKNRVTRKSSNRSTTHLNPGAMPTPPPAPSMEVSAVTPVLATSAAALASAVAAAAPITPPGDLPPAVGAPAPREGWAPTPKKKRSAKGLRPKGAQISNAVAAAKELTQSTTYVADFGSRAPAAGQVAFVVTNAARWRDTWQAARRFFVYATEQRAIWENDALAQMQALKPAFDYAASRDTTVAEKYSATSKYLGEASAIALRAASVRKASKRNAVHTGSNGATSAPRVASSPSASPIAPGASVSPSSPLPR